MRPAKASDTKFMQTPSTPTRCLVADGGQAFEPYGFSTRRTKELLQTVGPISESPSRGTGTGSLRPGLFQVAD